MHCFFFTCRCILTRIRLSLCFDRHLRPWLFMFSFHHFFLSFRIVERLRHQIEYMYMSPPYPPPPPASPLLLIGHITPACPSERISLCKRFELHASRLGTFPKNLDYLSSLIVVQLTISIILSLLFCPSPPRLSHFTQPW